MDIIAGVLQEDTVVLQVIISTLQHLQLADQMVPLRSRRHRE